MIDKNTGGKFAMKKRMACVFILAVAGCNTTNEHYGRGPLQLTAQAEQAYQGYRLINTVDKAMAVSPSGNAYSIARCGVDGYRVDPTVRCLDNPEWLAIKWCDEQGRGKCKIYASGNNIVWDRNPISTQMANKPITPTNETTTNQKILNRAVLVVWEGHTNPLRGTVEFNESMTTARVSLNVAGSNEKCLGVSTLQGRQDGTWAISCDNGTTATGKWQGIGTGRGSIGEGLDNQGKKVSFVVDEAR